MSTVYSSPFVFSDALLSVNRFSSAHEHTTKIDVAKISLGKFLKAKKFINPEKYNLIVFISYWGKAV